MSLRIASLFLLLLPTVASQCTLCHAGSDPPDSDLVLDEYKPLSCGALERTAKLATASCDDWLVPGLLCGCPAPFENQGVTEDSYRYFHEGEDVPRGGRVRRRLLQ